MRLLHLVHCYPPAIGGTELLMAEVSERLVRDHGHEVTVVTSTGYNTDSFRGSVDRQLAAGEESRGGVTVRRHRADPRLPQRLARSARRAYRHRLPGNALLRSVADGPISTGMIEDLLRTPAESIAAAAFPLLHMPAAVLAGRARRVPVILNGCLHAHDLYGFDRPPIRSAARAADAYVALTTYEAEIVSGWGVSNDRIHVIPPGVDDGAFRSDAAVAAERAATRARLGIPDDAVVVGFIGQLGAHKGVLDVVEAMREAWQLSRNTELWLLVAGGRTPLLPTLMAALATLPRWGRERLRLLVDFPPGDKPGLYAAIDILASPSGHESFGITYVEAWAAGRPVIGCRGGAVEHVITDGETGLLVGVGRPRELAAAIVELAEEPSLRARVGDAGRRAASARFRWSVAAAAWDALHRDVAGGG